MLTDVLPLCRGSAQARRQCRAWREQGGDPAPGTGGTLGPTGTGTGGDPGDHLLSLGCAAQQDCLHPSPHPLAVGDPLCSRSSRPSAAATFGASPSRSPKPPWMHQMQHGEHHAFLTPSSLSLAPAPPASPCSLLVLLGLRNTNNGGSAAPSSRRGEARSARHVGARRFAGAECFSFQVTQALLLLRG